MELLLSHLGAQITAFIKTVMKKLFEIQSQRLLLFNISPATAVSQQEFFNYGLPHFPYLPLFEGGGGGHPARLT